MSERRAVIDASALLALMLGEHLGVGREAFANGILSTVSLAEVLTKLVDLGAESDEALADVELIGLDLSIVDFDQETASRAAALRPLGKRLGLSLADRACLATAQLRGLEVLTADRTWAKLDGFNVISAR